MLAVGGLVRSRTPEILAIATGVAAAVGPDVRLHLLGVARDDIIPDLARLGIFSFDSASPMRTSWMSATKNYLLGDTYYTAIRIPITKPEEAGAKGMGILARAKTESSYADLQDLETAALTRSSRRMPSGRVSIDDAMKHIEAYDLEQTRKSEVAGSRARRMENYRRTLIDRPWTKCDCAVCKDVGVEVVIFRRQRPEPSPRLPQRPRLLQEPPSTRAAGSGRAAANLNGPVARGVRPRDRLSRRRHLQGRLGPPWQLRTSRNRW